MTEKKEILEKITDIYQRASAAKAATAQLRQELADAILEAKQAGILYREITDAIGISKTGISSILTRGTKND